MKSKTSKYLWLIFFLSLFPALLIFKTPLLLHTHDGPVHLARMAAWFKAFESGQIPPRWAADLNYGFGTPILIFIYPLPYFFSYLFLKIGFGLVFTYKAVLFLSFLLSGGFMFLALAEWWKDEKKAFLATLFYQFHSFRLIELLVRGAFGEVFTYTFFPLSLWGISKIFKGQLRSGFLLTVFAITLLVLSHNSVSLVFFAVLVFFILFFSQNWRKLFWSFVSLAAGLALAAFYWLPALWERKFTYGDLFMKNLYLEHFPSLRQLFLPNFFNQSWGQVGGISVQLGLLPLLAMLSSAGLLWRKRNSGSEKKLFIFSWLIFLGSLFIMNPLSLPLWQKISLLRQFQFSWRFLSLVILATSLASLSFFSLFQKRAWRYFVLAALVVLTSLPYWRTLGFDQIDEKDFWTYPLNTTYFGEADTIWAAGAPNAYPKNRIEIVEGKGEIKNLVLTQTKHSFEIDAVTSVNVLDNTFFFPGWRVFVNGKLVPIEFQDQNRRGLITFRLNPGIYQIVVHFGHTKARQISEIISLSALLITFFIYFRLRNLKINFSRKQNLGRRYRI